MPEDESLRRRVVGRQPRAVVVVVRDEVLAEERGCGAGVAALAGDHIGIRGGWLNRLGRGVLSLFIFGVPFSLPCLAWILTARKRARSFKVKFGQNMLVVQLFRRQRPFAVVAIEPWWIRRGDGLSHWLTAFADSVVFGVPLAVGRLSFGRRRRLHLHEGRVVAGRFQDEVAALKHLVEAPEIVALVVRLGIPQTAVSARLRRRRRRRSRCGHASVRSSGRRVLYARDIDEVDLAHEVVLRRRGGPLHHPAVGLLLGRHLLLGDGFVNASGGGPALEEQTGRRRVVSPRPVPTRGQEAPPRRRRLLQLQRRHEVRRLVRRRPTVS